MDVSSFYFTALYVLSIWCPFKSSEGYKFLFCFFPVLHSSSWVSGVTGRRFHFPSYFYAGAFWVRFSILTLCPDLKLIFFHFIKCKTLNETSMRNEHCQALSRGKNYYYYCFGVFPTRLFLLCLNEIAVTKYVQFSFQPQSSYKWDSLAWNVPSLPTPSSYFCHSWWVV